MGLAGDVMPYLKKLNLALIDSILEKPNPSNLNMVGALIQYPLGSYITARYKSVRFDMATESNLIRFIMTVKSK